jgi:hypothetical protein
LIEIESNIFFLFVPFSISKYDEELLSIKCFDIKDFLDRARKKISGAWHD